MTTAGMLSEATNLCLEPLPFDIKVQEDSTSWHLDKTTQPFVQ